MAQRTRSRASSANNDGGNEENDGTIATADAPEGGREFGSEGFLNLADLKEMSISKLTSIAKGMDVPGATGIRIRRATSRAHFQRKSNHSSPSARPAL